MERAILGPAGFVTGLGGGELGIFGENADGGIARLEERKGVGDIVSEERIFPFKLDLADRLLREYRTCCRDDSSDSDETRLRLQVVCVLSYVDVKDSLVSLQVSQR